MKITRELYHWMLEVYGNVFIYRGEILDPINIIRRISKGNEKETIPQKKDKQKE